MSKKSRENKAEKNNLTIFENRYSTCWHADTSGYIRRPMNSIKLYNVHLPDNSVKAFETFEDALVYLRMMT